MQSRLIVGTAIVFWLLGLLITDRTPAWVSFVFGVMFFFATAGLIAFLMVRGTGWRALASKYPERTPHTGQLRKCRTFQMLALESDQPFGTRLSGSIVSVGTTPSALYISMSAIARSLFPTIQLPWSAIASARPFEARGWVTPMVTPGTVFQREYDPGFHGQFIELATTEPKTRIRLPLSVLEEARTYLPLSRV